ncbi:MAG: beta-galactosidase trimerization domain-containing protein, partial [Clostridia bacterium]|nr:beta-galactosidase trimerization domain-containing protein [Clostridia bacterium]
RPMHIVDEVIQVSDEFKRAAYFINGTFVQTEAAISVSTHNHFLTMNQAVYSDEYPWYDRYSNRVRRVYSALKESGIQTDVIAHGADLGKYRLLFSPFEMYMETDFTERVMEWV